MLPLVGGYETIYAFKGSEGVVRLQRQRLMDGSLVYDVLLYNEMNQPIFTLSPANKKEADSLFKAIKSAMP